ncbi:MAG: hypothetical protein ACREUX_17075 [Burkholderiales bacterium]
MWEWIVGRRKPRHALDRELSTPPALRRFIAGLATGTPEASLQAVAAVFEAARELGIAPVARLQALSALDEFARSSCRVLAGRLLDDSPRQVLCEGVWQHQFQYYRALDAGYTAAIEAFDAGACDSAMHAQIALAACRAMQAMAKCNMLLRMRYREPSAASWQRIERLLVLATARSAASALLALYPDEPGESALVREYLIAATSETVPNANLLPAQIHGADLLLRRHAAEFRLGESFDALAMPFALDPARDARPMRWLDGLAIRPGMRFFGLGQTYAHILAERERAERTRSTPQWLAPSRLSAERYRELLDALAAQWAPEPPARRHRREPAAGEILVAHDFPLIRRLIGFGELARTGRSLEYDRFSAYDINGMVRGHNDVQLRGPTETRTVSAEEALRNLETFERALEPGAIELWRIADTSDTGLGAEATGTITWLKPGLLIAYRSPDSAQWALAAVRRLNRVTEGALRVGMYKLSGSAQGARVALNDPRQVPRSTPAAPALHYDAIMLAGDEPSLLLPPGIFDPAWRYTLTVGNRWDFIRMRRCTECGLDFERIDYTIVRAQQAA